MEETLTTTDANIAFNSFKDEVLSDLKLALLSREASLLGRREVLTGKAKFGIFGDGKELAQIALAKQFQNGDFRSGYYRDQTFMMAIGKLNVEQFFAGLYAHPSLEHEPNSAGRQMGGHFMTHSLNEDGSWKRLTDQKNSSADLSPTASQMPRLLGLAQASKVFRNNPNLKEFDQFSIEGNEIAFGTIGDASTSEGLFWETINAGGVLQVPMLVSVWDDGYGISVPKKYQTTKGNISDVLRGFKREDDRDGYNMFKVNGWDYISLCETYRKAALACRKEHIPTLVHVEELTQPQGHSTSGSHERYKSPERLAWAKEFDCIAKFKEWIANFKGKKGELIATQEEIDNLHNEIKKQVREAKTNAWNNYLASIAPSKDGIIELANQILQESANKNFIQPILDTLVRDASAGRKEVLSTARAILRLIRNEDIPSKPNLQRWILERIGINHERYGSNLYSESNQNALSVPYHTADYTNSTEDVDGRIVLRKNFEHIFEHNPLVLTFGEDTGFIGGVNQSMEGMQEKFGEIRVSDTGIREATIIGQGIGMALRGLRPIAEIQYLDYLLYAIQIISDDLASLQYRTVGKQKAPLIIRTRGHRLEGIWHSGSPMGMIINAVRGVYVCVPRNMTEAAGFYNTLLQSDDTAIVIEPLNGYRTKEKLPTNIGEFTTPLGIPEIVREGTDVTLVSYGSTFNLCSVAAQKLQEAGISVELVDARTLLPFDVNHIIAYSLKKTNKLVCVDEDVPGGASAYLLDQILVKQKGYQWLDAQPLTISAKAHRPAYGSDGDYFSKPSVDDIFEGVYGVMSDYNPGEFVELY